MEISLLNEQLKTEIPLLKELISVLHMETEDLVSRDYKRLYDTVSRKEHLMLRIEAMGRLRSKLLYDAAVASGSPENINLSSVIDAADGRLKAELKESQSTLLTLSESVKELSNVNSLVIKGSLENITKALGLLGNFMPKGVYRPSGNYESISLKGTQLSKGA